MKKAEAMEKALYIASLIDWESVLPRANAGLLEKDEPMTRENWVDMCVKSLVKTDSPVKVGSHGDKLEGLVSVSTSSRCNARCMEMMQNKGTICSHCYTKSYLSMRPELRRAVVYNYILLTQVLLEDWMIPRLYVVFARIESWGDLELPKNGGIIQARNYVRIAKANRRTRFGWWTKSPAVMQEGINAECGKPENMNCIYSSPLMNKAVEIDGLREKYPCIDKVFTVYDRQYVAANPGCKNCQKKCWECGLCYTQNAVTAIGEEVK